MANRGEKHTHVLTTEGHKCMLNMQVTDVKKPLMSVARICDAEEGVLPRAWSHVVDQGQRQAGFKTRSS